MQCPIDFIVQQVNRGEAFRDACVAMRKVFFMTDDRYERIVLAAKNEIYGNGIR